MNSNFFLNSIRFFLLLLMQIIVFNNIELYGYINPYPYILFILLYPVNPNKYGFLIWSFLLGLIIDIFCNSGGIHAAASVILAYSRHKIFKVSFGLSYEYQTIKIGNVALNQQITFVGLSVLIHHIVLFSLEAFRFDLLGTAMLKVLFSGIFTTIFSILIINLFKVSKK
ncbi:MAG TPA: rod shape-determining protein MreD [Flavobacterium sp.]|nr:rod shape-determining protein MreD [Flavobacterium sp.]